MRAFSLRILLPILTLLPLLLGACSAPKNKDFVPTPDVKHPVTESRTIEGVTYYPNDPGYAEAREIKLKVRELADQLVADMQDCSLQGLVALPTSFVNLNDFNESSGFGRLFAEQLFYELNQRNYPVREYRTPGAIQPSPKAGEFTLSRELGRLSARGQKAVIVLGTYSQTENAVFVNARLVKPSDGRVLRTANLVMESNPTVVSLLSTKGYNSRSLGGKGAGKALADGGMRIRDFDRATKPAPKRDLTAIDMGQDIH